ncbi:MAG: uvrD1 [Haloplasmataceae bacterium]|jgi:hypothetical protein|nr:uvrD1 [Haloplasmataceae bacterium]
MGIFNNTNANEDKLEKEYEKMLIEGEEIVQAYKTVRDLIMITSFRFITIDKQGVTGKKQHIICYPLNRVVKYEIENSPYFDIDSEIVIWFEGVQEPVKFTLSKGTNCFEFIKNLTSSMFIH